MQESASQGKPNKLAKETSPYLLQHAYNPVDWYPWGNEALERAKVEGKTILLQLAAAYKDKTQEIEAASGEFMGALTQTAKDIALGVADKSNLERSILDEAAMGLLQMGDPIYGGFGQAPKFPNASNLMFLLRYYDISGMTRFKDFVAFAADKMVAGGIHDHLGGGFARHPTDQKCLVPHFVKMTLHNCLLA